MANGIPLPVNIRHNAHNFSKVFIICLMVTHIKHSVVGKLALPVIAFFVREVQIIVKQIDICKTDCCNIVNRSTAVNIHVYIYICFIIDHECS
jgi:hypothetical protein